MLTYGCCFVFVNTATANLRRYLRIYLEFFVYEMLHEYQNTILRTSQRKADVRTFFCVREYAHRGDYGYCSVPIQVFPDTVQGVSRLRSESKGLQKNKLSMQKMFRRRSWIQRLHSRNDQMPPLDSKTVWNNRKDKKSSTYLKNKVTFQRARQILAEKPINRTLGSYHTPTFPALFDVTLPKKCQAKDKPMANLGLFFGKSAPLPPGNARGKSNCPKTGRFEYFIIFRYRDEHENIFFLQLYSV